MANAERQFRGNPVTGPRPGGYETTGASPPALGRGTDETTMISTALEIVIGSGLLGLLVLAVVLDALDRADRNIGPDDDDRD